MKNKQFSFRYRLKSFRFAFNGLKYLIEREHNARIHLVATALVITFGFAFKISLKEWMSLIIVIGLVLVSEIFNTAIETICDFISPQKHENIKKIKDLSAAAVLVSAVIAFIIGTLIFIQIC